MLTTSAYYVGLTTLRQLPTISGACCCMVPVLLYDSTLCSSVVAIKQRVLDYEIVRGHVNAQTGDEHDSGDMEIKSEDFEITG